MRIDRLLPPCTLMAINFIALDVETANADLASVCQIGLARFENGCFADKWESLIDPVDEFDPMNVSVHKITPRTVVGAPRFSDVAFELSARIRDSVVVCHTPFDQGAIRSAYSKNGLVSPEVRWLDSSRVVRRVWPELSHRGYGLASVARRLGVAFTHHDAAEDARAAGEILVRAIAESTRSLEEWLLLATSPIGLQADAATSWGIARDGNPHGPLFGEVVVFTGRLSLSRRQAADLASASGCKVAERVTKQTTLLVVGDQDIRRLGGNDKSSKHREAEEFISRGASIRILQESDFLSLTKATV